MVLLFSFFFCSGGFLVAHAESVTVVISGSNVTSKPSGWDGNSTYNRVVHYPTTKPEGLLNSYYDALSLSDIGYVTFDTLFQNTGNVQFPYTIQSRLSANFPSVTSWLPSNPHSYTVGSTGASLNYTSIARAGDMLELVPVSNVLLTPGVHYLLSVSLSSISSLESVGFVNYPSEVKVVDSIISISEVAGQTFFNGQISFTVSSPVSIRSLPVRSVFYNDSTAEVYQYSLSYSGYSSSTDVIAAIEKQTGELDQSITDAGQGVQDKIESQFDTSQGAEVGSAAQGFADQAAESLGVVSYVDTLFSGLSGLVTAGSTTLTFPAFAIAVQGTDYQVWQEHTFDLSQLDGWFSGLMAAVRLATSVVVVGAVIHYLQSVYKDVIG